MFLAFVLYNPHDEIYFSISSTVSLFISFAFGAILNNSFVTIFTLASVHCADNNTAIAI